MPCHIRSIKPTSTNTAHAQTDLNAINDAYAEVWCHYSYSTSSDKLFRGIWILLRYLLIRRSYVIDDLKRNQNRLCDMWVIISTFLWDSYWLIVDRNIIVSCLLNVRSPFIGSKNNVKMSNQSYHKKVKMFP